MTDKQTVSLSDLLSAADEVENLKSAIETTWRPEVNALRAENERLRAENAQLLAAIGSWRQALDRALKAPLEAAE